MPDALNARHRRRNLTWTWSRSLSWRRAEHTSAKGQVSVSPKGRKQLQHLTSRRLAILQTTPQWKWHWPMEMGLATGIGIGAVAHLTLDHSALQLGFSWARLLPLLLEVRLIYGSVPHINNIICHPTPTRPCHKLVSHTSISLCAEKKYLPFRNRHRRLLILNNIEEC